jgi:hypothetical protein
MKLVPLSLVLALVVLAGATTTAGAAPSSRASSGAFCSVARGVARDILNATSISNGKVIPANIRITYTKVAAAEPALLAAAPAPVKANLKPVFGLVNGIIVVFKKVNWNPQAVTPYLAPLLPRWNAAQKPLQSLRVYFRTTCKLDV